MQRTYDVPARRVGLVALVAMLVLLALPSTSIAGGASQSTRSPSDASAGLLQLGAGYAADGEAPRVRALQRKLRALGWQPGRTDGLFGPRTGRRSPASSKPPVSRPTGLSDRPRARPFAGPPAAG
jgi:hypothetical protein